MVDAILILILILILGLAGFYVYKAKKSGKTCIGCPHSGSCSNQKNGSCSEK